MATTPPLPTGAVSTPPLPQGTLTFDPGEIDIETGAPNKIRATISAYKKPEDKLKLISKECDYLFLPKSEELLNGIHQETSKYNNFLCGIDRPEHFNGVASIIRKFLKIIQRI